MEINVSSDVKEEIWRGIETADRYIFKRVC
jgi:hypothetical protein